MPDNASNPRFGHVVLAVTHGVNVVGSTGEVGHLPRACSRDLQCLRPRCPSIRLPQFPRLLSSANPPLDINSRRLDKDFPPLPSTSFPWLFLRTRQLDLFKSSDSLPPILFLHCGTCEAADTASDYTRPSHLFLHYLVQHNHDPFVYLKHGSHHIRPAQPGEFSVHDDRTYQLDPKGEEETA